MGIKLFSNSQCGPVIGPEDNVAPNPNPHKFKLLSILKSHQVYLAEVQYEGCTTFEGRKLLMTTVDVSEYTELDPHLLGGDHCVIARFEPTGMGYQMALAAACAYTRE